MNIKRLLAILLVLVMLVATFAGCKPAEPVVSDEPSPGDAPASAEPVATEDPNAEKYGGTVILPLGADPSTWLYWVTDTNGGIYQTINNDVLFYLDPDTKEINYRVCESMDISDDQCVYTLHIRNDVYWHDGVQLTAEDVVWSHDL